MGSTKKLTSMVPVALLVAGLAAPQMANAADLLIDPPIIEAPEVVTQQSGGWYLRGDITYDIHSMDNPMYSAGGTELTFATAETSEAFDIGLGVGYQINENFRVDLTGEYLFSSDFRGTTVGTCGDSNPGDGLPGSDGPVHHQTFADPYDPTIRRALLDAGVAIPDLRLHDGGTMVVINGPRFSTRAESQWFAQMGWSVVNMTGYPEAVLAAEAGLRYASVALVTDHDAGDAATTAAVTMDAVMNVVRQNVANVQRLIAATVPLLG